MRTRKKTDGLRDFIFSMHYSEKNGWLARLHLQYALQFTRSSLSAANGDSTVEGVTES